MDSLTYQVLFRIACDEQPKLHLIAVCSYDLFVTEQRIAGIHRELVGEINYNGERFNQPIVTRVNGQTLNVDLFYIPMDPAQMVVAPDPSLGAAGRVPKSTNSCVNISMRDVHHLLYPLTKPVG